jgi:hypothetical protein
VSRPHVCVMTPLYDGRVTTTYLDFISQSISAEDFTFSYRYHVGDSLVTRARNTLVSDYVSMVDSAEWTHLLWVDGDVGLASDGIARLLARQVDVIGAPVPMKGEAPGRHGIRQSVLGPVVELEPMLYTVEYVATGCLMMSRKAIETLVNYCKSNGLEYEDEGTRWDVFRNGSRAGFYDSEDWHVCRLLRELGFTIYVDSSFAVAHDDGPRQKWIRPACPVAETAIANDHSGQIAESNRAQRWCPANFGS